MGKIGVAAVLNIVGMFLIALAIVLIQVQEPPNWETIWSIVFGGLIAFIAAHLPWTA